MDAKTEELSLDMKIEELALKADELRNIIEEAEERLGEDKKKYNELTMKELPELLESQGLTIGSRLVLKNGSTLILKDFFSCSIPSESKINSEKDFEKRTLLSERRKEALNWLTENNLKDIIKDFIDININKDPKLTEKVLKWVEENGLDYTHDETVHPLTLKATLKEQMGRGLEIPFETFDITTGCIVSFEKKKR